MFGFFQQPKPYPPPLALDELAAAFHLVRSEPRPRRIVRSLKLSAQLPGDLSPPHWDRLAEALDCHLPNLEFGPGGTWRFPRKWESILDVLTHAAGQHPEWQLPDEVTVRDWVRAQIFAGVRDCFVEQLNLPREAIHREASIVNDLVGPDW